jgi:hypothetical protein
MDDSEPIRQGFLWWHAAAGVVFFVVLSGMFSLLQFPGPPENPPLPPLTVLLKEYGLVIGVACSIMHVWKVFCAKNLPTERKLEVMFITVSILLVFSSVYVVGVLSFCLSPIPLEP